MMSQLAKSVLMSMHSISGPLSEESGEVVLAHQIQLSTLIKSNDYFDSRWFLKQSKSFFEQKNDLQNKVYVFWSVE